MKNLKKFAGAFLVFCVGLFFVPDFASLATYIYRLSMVGMLLVLNLWIIGEVDDWGLFPEIDFSKLIAKSSETSSGAATVFLSLVLLMCTIIYAIIH